MCERDREKKVELETRERKTIYQEIFIYASQIREKCTYTYKKKACDAQQTPSCLLLRYHSCVSRFFAIIILITVNQLRGI